ncbi:MAG: HAMP domain-containing histidine kinase [Fervidobacterium sp.]|nr:HAMP domain-containing histidine kinase [Fervidobacterium sp.]
MEKNEEREKNRSDKFLLINIFIGIALAIIFIIFAFNYIDSWFHGLENVFLSFNESLVYPAWTLNKNLVDTILKTMIKKKDIVSIIVYDDKGEILGSVIEENNPTILHSIFGLRNKYYESRMYYKSFFVGKVIFGYTYYEPVKSLFVFALVFVTLYFAIYMALKNLEKNVRLKELVAQLNDANNELEITLSELEETQQRVINSEKMAVLGKLMVNIAHDVNTPTGIIYSSLTDLKNRMNNIISSLDREELTEEQLRDFLTVSDELVSIMLRNAQRIRELVQSLKRVAVNEITQTYATVSMKDVVNDVLNALHPRLRKTKVTVHTDIPDNLTVRTIPGAWAQILMNLIDNSIIHAFDYDNPGEINIKFTNYDDKLMMIFSDNGKGMSEETKRRAFEPFYTTDTTAGTGIGLSIVYQLVTELLKGEINLESQEGVGTTFKIIVPMSQENNLSK